VADSNLSWQIAFNAVVSFLLSPSARSFVSGACSMKLRSAAKIPLFNESSPRRGRGGNLVQWW